MKQDRVKQILAEIRKVKIAVYGDFCLDAYWMMDPRGSEVSAETGLQADAVARHYYTLGGASSVVANLAALQPAYIQVIGCVGDDIFGRELTRQLQQLHVDMQALVVQKENFDTVTFSKRHLEGNELPRIDFGFFNQRSLPTDDALIASLRRALQTVDVLIFNQQVPGSIPHVSFLKRANAMFEEFREKIVLLDTRHYGSQIRNIYRKTNDLDAARLNGVQTHPDDVIALPDVERFGSKLFLQLHKPVFVTRGARGIVVFDREGLCYLPGIQLLKQLDTVGAGDTTTSALALCLGAGISPRESAEFANFAAAVTVQKLFQTGTAAPAEVLEISADADYIYQPELAEDLRQARYLEGSEIEFCYPRETIPFGPIKHAVFDHDGTISTLRQGWEQTMEPVMVRAVLGDRYQTADETLYHKVVNRVRDYIDKSTGSQTILQMEALVEMVAEFGIVPPEKMLDKFGYKQIYNEALMQLVNQRLAKFQTGQFELHDYTMKGAVEFLHALKQRGVTLYLASGTDCQDVLNEAQVLGYAGLFGGRIYGAVGDIKDYSKKMIIEKIMTENKLCGPELAVFGDGPVEIRECRKRDGIAVGIVSDEVRRHGLNPEKRSRLVNAGAHLMVPDFSQADRLLEVLFG